MRGLKKEAHVKTIKLYLRAAGHNEKGAPWVGGARKREQRPAQFMRQRISSVRMSAPDRDERRRCTCTQTGHQPAGADAACYERKKKAQDGAKQRESFENVLARQAVHCYMLGQPDTGSKTGLCQKRSVAEDAKQALVLQVGYASCRGCITIHLRGVCSQD